MDVWPLIGTGLGPSKFFDPTILWQFKIAHGATNYKEDEVIQMYATGTNASQVISLYGPGKPNEVGTANTLLKTATGSTVYNTSTTTLQKSTVKFFAGPRADSFVFDLLAFYTFLGDRNYGTHTSQTDPGAGDNIPNVNGNLYQPVVGLSPAYNKTPDRVMHPSFNGFLATDTSTTGTNPAVAGGYACSVGGASNTLGIFDVLSFVVEVPKSLLETGYASHVIHVWATSSSSTVKS